MKSCYEPVKNLEGFLEGVEELIDDSTLYEMISGLCVLSAEKYHIDNIIKLYRRLK